VQDRPRAVEDHADLPAQFARQLSHLPGQFRGHHPIRGNPAAGQSHESPQLAGAQAGGMTVNHKAGGVSGVEWKGWPDIAGEQLRSNEGSRNTGAFIMRRWSGSNMFRR
jgi:hypothetical protein